MPLRVTQAAVSRAAPGTTSPRRSCGRRTLRQTRCLHCTPYPASHQACEQILCKPALAGLGSKALQQRCRLVIHNFPRQRHIKRRAAQIAVPFWNLVFQHQMVAERVPGQFADHSVILMPVMLMMRENQIRIAAPFQPLKALLELRPRHWKEAVAKFMQLYFDIARRRQQACYRCARFGRTLSFP